MRLLLGVLAVGCLSGAYLALKMQNEKAEEEEAEAAQGEVILEVDPDEITALSFRIGEETYFFTQADDTWKLESDETFPVDESALLSPLSQLESLHSERTLTEVEDISEYGLDDPQNVITLTDSEQQQTVLTIGATNDGTGNDYLMLNGDESVVYTVDAALRTAFASDLYDVALSEELPVLSAADIIGVDVERDSDGYRLYLEDAVWKVADASGAAAADVNDTDAADVSDADADAVNDALAAFAAVTYTGYLEHNCTDLSPYGLEDPSAVLTISYKEDVETDTEAEAAAASETEESGVAETEEYETEAGESYRVATLRFMIGDTDSAGDYYVQLDGSKEVHTISADVLSAFMSTASADWIAEPENEPETSAAESAEAESETETFAAEGAEAESETETSDAEGAEESETEENPVD